MLPWTRPTRIGLAGVRPLGDRGAATAPHRNADNDRQDEQQWSIGTQRPHSTQRRIRWPRGPCGLCVQDRTCRDCARRADRRDQHRHAVHAEQARELRDRQDAGLAVAEQDPREPGEEMRAAEFGRNPDDRRRHQRQRPVRNDDPAYDEREDRGKQREVGDERRVDEHGDPRREVAVHHHHPRDPVQRAGEVHDAGDQAEDEGAAERGSRQRDQQRRERDPAERGMTEFREAEGEEDARRGG